MKSKKERRNAYKQIKFRTGIYQIKNKENGKLFLQTSQDLDRGSNSDLFKLKSGVHPNKELQSDWNTSGSENFEFGILDEIELKETSSASEMKAELQEFLELHRNELLESGKLLY